MKISSLKAKVCFRPWTFSFRQYERSYVTSMYIVGKKQDFTLIRNDKVRAEIELTNINELSKILNELIDKGERNILINFQNVVYIDSSALGVLMDAIKKLKKQDGELGILSISRNILEVFIATQIAQYFKYYKSAS